MCGIYGYVGTKDAEVAFMAHGALCDLEYRGYDSWGIAALTPTGVYAKKSVGKISDTPAETFSGVSGKIAIGHSRWATHGGVSEANAHPHFDRSRRIAVIHNGIVENHDELRAFLTSRLDVSAGELFRSETDTEVIPHLIDYFISKEGRSFEEAFVAVGRMLEGRYAVVVMKQGEPYLLAMRDGSPLVLGKGEEGYFLASDVPAFIDETRVVCYPKDRQYAKIAAGSVMLRDLDSGKRVDEEWREVAWDKQSASKDGHPHYMLKEILEQGESLDKAIRQDDGKLNEMAKVMKAAEKLFFIGCGTAAKMAKLGELYAARVGGKFSSSFVGSEFGAYEQFLDRKSTLFAVSQSGETADVLEAFRAGEKKGTTLLALLNVVGSSMDRMAKKALFINAGPEIAVASTKAATAQIALLILIAHALGGKLADGKHVLRAAVKDIKAWLTSDLSYEVLSAAKKLSAAKDIYIIGRGLNAPIAHEAAIKIQEVSYIHAEGFAGGELKHGPIALIERGTPAIALVSNDETKKDMESNIAELKARGAIILGIAPEPNKLFDEWIRVPALGLASPIASLIPIQLLAYHLAVLRGNDPDKPRNLAKSVTVK